MKLATSKIALLAAVAMFGAVASMTSMVQAGERTTGRGTGPINWARKG